MIRRPPRSTLSSSSAASDVYKRQVLWQHLLHRTIVFGTSQPYWSSLARVAVVYVGSLVLSAGLNMLVIEVLYLHSTIGFLVTTAFVGILNYLAMVRFGFSGEFDDQSDDHNHTAVKDVVVLSFDPIVDLSLAEFRSIGDKLQTYVGSTKSALKAGGHSA
eukprot:TRINITY_DN17762_c0_g1_i2.p1 TRINITY_DN17762_c0_g1~~TRINITY_DN17762_c0_g1_i2.p1  ORF type:complete len:160 (+),score=41.80 TRINITY_DN17762_c0_g1_i2:115-594(+)